MSDSVQIDPTALSLLRSMALTARSRKTRNFIEKTIRSATTKLQITVSQNDGTSNCLNSLLQVSEILRQHTSLLVAWNDSGQRDLMARQQWRSAFRYPIILIVCCLVAGFLGNVSGTMTSLKSNFGDVVESSRDSFSTSVLASELVTTIAATLIIGTILVRLAAGKRIWGILNSCLPWIGASHRQLVAAQLLRKTGILLAARTPLPIAMELAGQTCDDLAGEYFWGRVARRIQQGSSLSDAIAKEPWLPKSATALIHAGQSNNMLDATLQLAADLLEDQSRITAKLMNYLLPALTLLFSIWFILTNYNSYISEFLKFLDAITY